MAEICGEKFIESYPLSSPVTKHEEFVSGERLEGVASRPLHVIEDGVLCFIHSLISSSMVIFRPVSSS